MAPEGRVRRPGGGRKKLAGTDPGLVPALLALVEDSARGDPESPLVWTTKSVKNLSGELTAQGHRCSPQTVWRLLHEQGFSTQANAKVTEGRRHPDRDAQFRYIAAQAREHLAAGQPVISVDAKKKEQVGEYAQAGREWRPEGGPVRARDHSFADEQAGHAIPYGVYDVAANTGFVNVGTDRNTAALAVESVRRWWDLAGGDAYPGAARLLICCDAGGSNGWRNRAWKAGLAELAQDTGLEITVCHFPPGTSKWNKIEHRLFSQITLAWRGRPLTSHDVIINTIGAVTTRTGLTVTAVLDGNRYPTGTAGQRQADDRPGDRALTRHAFHGDWNYAFPPPRPAPPGPPAPPAPAPAAAARAALAPVLAALASPELTGLSRPASPPWPPASNCPGPPPASSASTSAAATPAAPAPARPPPLSTPWKPSCWPPSATTGSACPTPTSPPCSAPTTPPSPRPAGHHHPARHRPSRPRTRPRPHPYPRRPANYAATAGITIPDPPPRGRLAHSTPDPATHPKPVYFGMLAQGSDPAGPGPCPKGYLPVPVAAVTGGVPGAHGRGCPSPGPGSHEES